MPGARLNVLLVTIDTLRADRVGVGLTPAIDALAASGLWFRDAIVWFTTVMAMLSYTVLLVVDWGKMNDLHKHIMFLVSLAVTGFVITYQVRRVRALSRYYERRSIT